MKVKIFSLFVLLIAGSINAFSQISEDKKIQIENQYDKVLWYTLKSDGYLEVIKNDLYGALDKNGNILFPCQYDHVYYSEGYFEVEKDKKLGAFDKNGKLLFPCLYEKVYYDEDEKHFEVTLKGKNGLLGYNGKQIIPCLYEDIYYDDDNDYYKVTLNGKVGTLDGKGKQIFPCIYDKIYKNDDPDYYELTYNGKVGIFDLKGKKIFDFIYTDVHWWQTTDHIGCEVKQGDKVGFVSKEGKELIPCQYDDIQYYAESNKDIYAKVIKNGKLGLFDVSKGKEVISCNYTYIKIDTSRKIAYVCLGGKYIPWQFIDYQETGDYFEENGKWGCIDIANARNLIPCEYNYIESVGENLFIFNSGGKLGQPNKKPMGGLWGVVDSNGKTLFNCEYTEIGDFKDGVAKAVKDGIASILVNPNAGTKLLLANGISACAIDKNIPKVNRQNDETFAFIFANENYKNCPGADFSINDGKVFEKYCNQTLGIPETNIKYYEDATFGNIQSAMKKIQDIADVYDGDAKIIFYYSGLGNTVEGERYILPSDASLASIKTTGISVNNVLQILNTLNTKYTLALFDAPFNGTDKSGKLLEAARGVRVKSKAPNLTGKTIAVFGSSDDKNNYCDKDNGHGLLTYNFLEQIQKTKGESSIKTLIDTTISNVGKQSLKEFNDIQKPQLIMSESMNNSLESLKF